jgi:hydroxymethylpyrimidine/phosphomethylpyrimidine kinase
MQTVLTIAGFDPSSGAGVSADLMVFAAHGLLGTACITALTVQSIRGVRSTHATNRSIVEATLDCLAMDMPPTGVKIGMLCNADNVWLVCSLADKIKAIHAGNGDDQAVPFVLDPVLRSTSGRELLDAEGVTALRDQLLKRMDWVTPNVDELAILSGVKVERREDVPGASIALQGEVLRATGGHALGIFATGGHLDSPDDYLLLPSGDGVWLPGTRVETASTHGTGCALSSAFLSRLVVGEEPIEAAKAAKEYVAGALRSTLRQGSEGRAMNHLWPLSKAVV